MLHTKQRTDTTELDRQVITELAPQMKRRASALRGAPPTQASVPEPQEQIPEWHSTHKPLSRRRIYLMLMLGALVGVILIILGTILVNWIGDIATHWHGGDSGVITLDTNTGHDAEGVTHLLAFYQSGHVIVVECSHDYKSSHVYSTIIGGTHDNHHVTGLALRTTDGRRDLVITLDGGIEILLYNTGDGFSVTQPQQ